MIVHARHPTLTAVSMSEFEQERLVTDALVYEGQQHWLHYRHIEQERNQFLGFFFTLLVAIVGFFVAISSRIPAWPTVAIGLTSMAAVFGLISLLILASVRKFGAALRAYDRDIERIRAALFTLAGPDRTHLAARQDSVSARMQPAMLHRVFDPQFAAEAIVGSFAAAAFAVQLIIAVDTLISDDFSTIQRAVACTLATASIAGAASAGRLWFRPRAPESEATAA